MILYLFGYGILLFVFSGFRIQGGFSYIKYLTLKIQYKYWLCSYVILEYRTIKFIIVRYWFDIISLYYHTKNITAFLYYKLTIVQYYNITSLFYYNVLLEHCMCFITMEYYEIKPCYNIVRWTVHNMLYIRLKYCSTMMFPRQRPTTSTVGCPDKGKIRLLAGIAPSQTGLAKQVSGPSI